MEHTDKLILDWYDNAIHARLDEFMFAAMESLADTLHFDSGCSISFDVARRTTYGVNSMHLHNQPIEKFMDHQRFEAGDSALDKALRRPGSAITETLADIDPRRKDMLAYCKRYEVANTLVLTQRNGTEGSVVALWRSKQRQVFTRAEIQLADRMLPHLIKSRDVNIALHGKKSPGSEQAFLITNPHGLIYFFNEDARTVLRTRWAQWEPPILPAEILQGLAASGRKQFCLGNLLATGIEEGRLLYIRLALRNQADVLSPAEQAVARLAAEGLPTKDIARQLGISPSTARNHLHHCYVKLNISNRTALARFFRGGSLQLA